MLGGAAFALAILAVGPWWFSQHRQQPQRQPILTRLTTDSGLSTDPALSPDGKLLAFASDRGGAGSLDIWVRQVAGGEPIRLTTDPTDDHEPSFSPDGSQIAFRSERNPAGIYVISALGGREPRLLAANGRNPRYSPDGKWVAYWTGELTAFTRACIWSRPQVDHQRPWSSVLPCSLPGIPSGRRTGSDCCSWRYPLGELKRGPIGGWPRWTPERHSPPAHLKCCGVTQSRCPYSSRPSQWQEGGILFSATAEGSTALWRIPVGRDGRITAPPARLTFGTGLDTEPSAASDGRVVFASLAENIDVWSLPIGANQAQPNGEMERVTQGAAADLHPSVSADGKQIVFRSNRSGAWDVWYRDLETGRESPVTADPENQSFPVMANSQVVYQTSRNQKNFTQLLAMTSGRPGAVAEKGCEECGGLNVAHRAARSGAGGSTATSFASAPVSTSNWYSKAKPGVLPRIATTNRASQTRLRTRSCQFSCETYSRAAPAGGSDSPGRPIAITGPHTPSASSMVSSRVHSFG